MTTYIAQVELNNSDSSYIFNFEDDITERKGLMGVTKGKSTYTQADEFAEKVRTVGFKYKSLAGIVQHFPAHRVEEVIVYEG